MVWQRIDLIGQEFGRLKVLSFAETRVTPNGTRRLYWNVRCGCGVTKMVAGNHLRNGRTSSCGCMKNPIVRKAVEEAR